MKPAPTRRLRRLNDPVVSAAAAAARRTIRPGYVIPIRWSIPAVLGKNRREQESRNGPVLIELAFDQKRRVWRQPSGALLFCLGVTFWTATFYVVLMPVTLLHGAKVRAARDWMVDGILDLGSQLL